MTHDIYKNIFIVIQQNKNPNLNELMEYNILCDSIIPSLYELPKNEILLNHIPYLLLIYLMINNVYDVPITDLIKYVTNKNIRSEWNQLESIIGLGYDYKWISETYSTKCRDIDFDETINQIKQTIQNKQL